MKRLIFSFVFLVLGAVLGGAGLYVGLNWKTYNPFRNKAENAAKSFLVKARAACVTEGALKGVYFKSVEIDDGKLQVRGWAADQKQLAALQSLGAAILDENPDIKSQCSNGISFEGLKFLAFLDRLPVWQREFEEFKGAEKNTPENAIKREVMRTTRLDGLDFDEEGKLIVRALSIRGDKNTGKTRQVLDDLLKGRIAAAGVPPELMPEIEMQVIHYPNPATTLQNKLANVPGAKEIRVVSAFYDGKGKLHLEALVANEDQRKFIDDAMGTILDDPVSLKMVIPTTVKEAVPDFLLRAIIFDPATYTKELQKRLVEYAKKENKAHLRRVLLTGVVPAPVLDDKKQIALDEEGNATYVFRVAGRVLGAAEAAKQTENDLDDWLVEVLPRMSNPNQTPIPPKLDLAVRESPVIALQARAAQRGFDGVAFTDAAYDIDGRLELLGRLHQPGDSARQELESAVKELLDGEAPWTFALMKPHETSKGAQAIAWTDAVRECRFILSTDANAGRRLRLDRLHFNYVGGQLKLIGEGVFLADNPKENPAVALVQALDQAVLSRGSVEVSLSGVKAINNPLPDVQDRLALRQDLDGVLLTHLRYDAEGRLHVEGFLGQPDHKAALTPVLAERWSEVPGLLRSAPDPKATPAWSLEGMKPHASAKGEWKWADVVRVCQSELAAAPESPLPQTLLERMYFRLVPSKDESMPRRVKLTSKTIQIVNPAEKPNSERVTKKLDDLARQLLPNAGVAEVSLEVRAAETPIFELQKLANEKRFDGMLFASAYFDHEGKLKFDGMRGGDTKDVRAMIEQTLARDKQPLAPKGLADLEKMKLSPWQATLEQIRGKFAAETQPIFRQTRIDRAYFEHEPKSGKPRVRLEGVCVYQGKTPTPEEVPTVLAEMLRQQFQAKGVAGFELAVDGIERKANPAIALQKLAVERGLDGVVFNDLGFDAKGACYVRLPLVPKGQAANIRKLLDEVAKENPYLKGIELR